MLGRLASLLLILLVCFSESSASAGAVPSEHACMGRWVGRGQNTGYTTYWSIELELTASAEGGRCGTIEYTNPACGGTLEACMLVGDEIHTQESYTHRGTCAPPGKVVLRCEGDEMRFSWVGWETVTTLLHRPGQGAATRTTTRQRAESPQPPAPLPGVAPVEPATPATSGGCGCSVASGTESNVGWALVLALLWPRRRNRRSP